MATLLYMTPAHPDTSTPTVASMRDQARAILIGRRIDPDSLADQGDVAQDLGVPRRSVSYLRQQYRGQDGTRGRDLEPFPAPARVVGGGPGNPVWLPRWEPLAWHLARVASGPGRAVVAGRRGGTTRWARARADTTEEEGTDA